MKQLKSLDIEGVFEVVNFVAKDERGVFVKTYHKDKLEEEIGIVECFKESYYSQSRKDVIRGMHFQLPPHDHEKLVYVTEGKILDVILDIRKNSTTYGLFRSIELSSFGNAVFIPKGCAHGFLTLSDKATVVYNVTTVYNQEADSGILWNSFGFRWPVAQPILSARDQAFASFKDYNSLF